MAFVFLPPVVFAFSALGYATYRYAKKEETSSPSLFIIDEKKCKNIAREALFACKSSPSLHAAKAGAAGAQVTGGDDDVARLGRLEKASCEDEYKVALKKCTSH
ncbi:unnamed protein product [Bathycoccus prasinos]|jgi:hypothetical protein|tara:strand:- start:2680 stop:2991 length:312 start_codon:yes stop_codon:yes gene_type:complete|mmetsp:Transcript_3364/g.12014  ORF Transcript_3364/g.12014 Transcript_3364/m.12014 type:complete len:104 (-) Transcript_3364:3750-4061(-)